MLYKSNFVFVFYSNKYCKGCMVFIGSISTWATSIVSFLISPLIWFDRAISTTNQVFSFINEMKVTKIFICRQIHHLKIETIH